MDDIPQIEQYHSLSFSEASAVGNENLKQIENRNMNGQELINNLISSLCGDEWEEAAEITEQIKATGDEELIRKAEYINSVL